MCCQQTKSLVSMAAAAAVVMSKSKVERREARQGAAVHYLATCISFGRWRRKRINSVPQYTMLLYQGTCNIRSTRAPNSTHFTSTITTTTTIDVSPRSCIIHYIHYPIITLEADSVSVPVLALHCRPTAKHNHHC